MNPLGLELCTSSDDIKKLLHVSINTVEVSRPDRSSPRSVIYSNGVEWDRKLRLQFTRMGGVENELTENRGSGESGRMVRTSKL